MDTIFALATAHGKAGVAIIRVSGPQANRALETLGALRPEPRRTSLQALKDPETGEAIDEALVLWFDAGASFTGEPVVELQIHGSVAVAQKLTQVLSEVADYRLAEPGEFTRRALINGRLDLAQVEGLADLIDAETEAQRRQAKRLFDGALSEKAAIWRDKLIEARSLLEAAIDFADEEVPTDVGEPVGQLIQELKSGFERELSGYGAAERTRTGFEVALVGRPNVGKSTLLNKLAGRDAAITSEFAGTTRDVLEVRMDLGGLPVTFLDTAGVRETDDAIEAIGVSRTRARAESADLRIFLVDDESEDLGIEQGAQDIIVETKADLTGKTQGAVSGKTGQGLDALVDRVSVILSGQAAGAATIVNQRQNRIMRNAVGHLELADGHLDMGPDGYDLASEEVRLATWDVGSLVGEVNIEHVYDEVFGRFCIGK